MRIIKCDRCGALIDPEQVDCIGRVSIRWETIATGDDAPNPFEHWDLCAGCKEEIEGFIKSRESWISREDHEVLMAKANTEKMAETVKAAQAEKPKKTGPHGWDRAAAQALRNKGASVKDIAKFCGVSEQTIRANTHPPKADEPQEEKEES